MDRITPEQRSRNMARVRGKDTQPELRVRRALFARGFRFRLHRKDLPGRPDIILPRYRVGVFVHGCFWHGHSCPRGRRPSSNAQFWQQKIERNMERDRRAVPELEAAGWTVKTIWQCSLDEGIEELIALLQRRKDAPAAGSIVSAR
jgi:DNA mismatch endonuclease (patch repair protein)